MELGANGKPRKVPFSIDGTRGSSTDSLTWASFEEVLAARTKGGYDGIGFVFSSGDPYTGIDFDDCFAPDGSLKEWAAAHIAALDGRAYIERSQSGTGLHVIVRGKASLWSGKHKHSVTEATEVYSTERYFVMTGDAYGSPVNGIAECQAELNSICHACKPPEQRSNGQQAQWSNGLTDEAALDVATKRFGSRLTALFYRGDLRAYNDDHSAADLGLVDMLAYACGPDAEQIDQLFRLSKLYRAKWDSQRGGSTYGADTIAKALSNREPNSYYRAKSGANAEITITPVSNLLDREPPDMVIDRWMESGTVGLLSGLSSRYKSFVGTDLAFCVACGVPWHGFRTMQGRSLILAAEGGTGLTKRIKAWGQFNRREVANAPVDIIERATSFYDPSVVNQLKAALSAQKDGYRLIVVDTLNRNSVGAEENSNSDMAQVLNHVQDVANTTGATVLVVHHVSKGAGAPRGASAIFNSVDHAFTAERDDEGRMQLSMAKQKDYADSGLITFEPVQVTLPDGQTSLVLQRIDDSLFTPPQQRNGTRTAQPQPPYMQAFGVLRLLCQQSPEGVTRADWLQACEASYDAKRGTFDRHRAALIEAQLVEQPGPRGLYRPLVTGFERMTGA
jgi:hypothetical protein